MSKRFENQWPYFLAILAATVIFLEPEAKSEGIAVPVTTVPADQSTVGGGELSKVTVTGYITPRIGDGPQPVTTLDRDFISKLASQTVGDLLQRVPQSIGAFNPLATTGNSFPRVPLLSVFAVCLSTPPLFWSMESDFRKPLCQSSLSTEDRSVLSI
jgi:hypothetical protein